MHGMLPFHIIRVWLVRAALSTQKICQKKVRYSGLACGARARLHCAIIMDGDW